MAYFPMFVDLTAKECLVVGGGSVALRKVKVLLDFDARIIVVAVEACAELMALSQANEKLLIEQRKVLPEDIENKELVILATDDAKLNSEMSLLCKSRGIPVNVVDKKEECSFILPSYVKENNVVAAFSSGGNSPVLTQYLKSKEYEVLTPTLGEINDCLGKWRRPIQELYSTEFERKNAFNQILEYALNKNVVPTDEEIKGVLGL